MIETELPDIVKSSDRTDVLSDGDLLRADGALSESGYAFSQVKRYARDAVVKCRSRIKERDCYYFGDDRHAVALSVMRNAHSTVASVTVLDFVHIEKAAKRRSAPKGRVKMPDSVNDGNFVFDNGGLKIAFLVEGGKRTLKCECKEIIGRKDFECEIRLDEHVGDNITTATPFEKRGEFLYATRIPCLKGSGWYTLGDERIEFSRAARGELEWGRGVYPRKCVWYRAGLSAEIDDTAFGLSIGRIGGKVSADENAVFSNGKGSKFKNAKFEIPFTLGVLDYLKPWKITDDTGRINLMFYPMIEVEEKTRIGIAGMRHKIFGKFYGKATLDDGTIIDIADKAGYAEHMITRW